MHNRSFCLLLILVFLSVVPLVTAQSTYATLSGVVVDETGAVVPQVKITVLNIATSSRREVSTSDEGYFSVKFSHGFSSSSYS